MKNKLSFIIIPLLFATAILFCVFSNSILPFYSVTQDSIDTVPVKYEDDLTPALMFNKQPDRQAVTDNEAEFITSVYGTAAEIVDAYTNKGAYSVVDSGSITSDGVCISAVDIVCSSDDTDYLIDFRTNEYGICFWKLRQINPATVSVETVNEEYRKIAADIEDIKGSPERYDERINALSEFILLADYLIYGNIDTYPHSYFDMYSLVILGDVSACYADGFIYIKFDYHGRVLCLQYDPSLGIYSGINTDGIIST